MSSPILSSTLAAARRAMRRHQRIPARSPVPLSRLLVGEALYGLRQLTRPALGLSALVAASLTVLALSSMTPGPVAPLPLRAVLAVAVGGLGGFIGARMFDAGPPSPRGSSGRTINALWGIGVLVAYTLVVVLAGALLAVLVSYVF